MSVVFTNCVDCKYLIVEKGKTFKYTCKAFPNGIPGAFMFRKNQNINEICNNTIKFKKNN